MIENNTNMKSM